MPDTYGTRRYYSSIAAATTLPSAIGTSDTSFSVASAAGFPSSVPFTLVLSPDTVNEEIVTVTARSGTSLTTVLRGQDQTTAKTHSANAVVRHMATAREFSDAAAHIDNHINVHGLTNTPGNKVVGTLEAGQVLEGKLMSGTANTFSAIPQSAVTSLETDLSNKAPKASPTLTGTVTMSGATSVSLPANTTGTTATPDTTSDTKVATTAFVQSVGNKKAPKPASGSGILVYNAAGSGTTEVKTISSGSNISVTNGTGLDAGNIIIAYSGTTPGTGTVTAVTAGTGLSGGTITTSGSLSVDFALVAALSSPALTGTPTAPTAGAGTNTTQIATTAFVKTATDAIIPSQTSNSGKYLTTNGTSTSWASITSDSGTLSSGITASAGWSITSQSYRKYNNIVQVSINLTRSGTTITVPASGNIANTTVATMPSGYRPAFEAMAVSGSNGRIASGAIDSGGAVVLTSVGTNSDNTVAAQDIQTNDTFTLNATFIAS